ncbi:ion channel [Paraburkholderia sediminicola]|uniref:ion channel n=1 Tax=Paraburkholderia sediminicola TaxID=458836 RepID=UPI0038BC1A18
MITFTRTGYGDYHPTVNWRIFAASEAIARYIFFGLFVSLLASYLSKCGAPKKRNGNPTITQRSRLPGGARTRRGSRRHRPNAVNA